MFNIIKLCRTTLHMPSWSTILCRQYTDLREYQTMSQYSDIAYIDQNYLAQYVRSSYLMLASDNVLHENPFLTKFRKQVGGFAVASSLNRPAKDQRNRSNFIFDNERPEDQEETNSNQPVIIYNRYLSKEEWKQIYCDYNQEEILR
uniref:Uncharacterized protein n=1 Tax=Ciona savignyi TaxID=51511 RepID=H2YLW4_CIOSA